MIRLFDIFFSALGLIILFPFFIVFYLLIRLESKGGAFYIQERIGKNGRPFMIYKFRTMIVNGEENGIPQLAEADDERLTRFGTLLRRNHLDELPQLWNVLCGDMSLVGYRPERKFFIDQIMQLRPDYELLFAIRPGITSMATIYNGYTNTMEKMLRRLRLDLYYLEHRSWLMDAKILIKTFIYIVFGKKF